MTDPQAKNQSKLAKKILLRGSTALLTLALAAAVTVTSGIVPDPVSSSAQAQNVSLSVQFRTALEPHGRWQRHGRWGEVWIPAKRDRDWRPYTSGRWTYTDRWGWYWVSDEDFGWVTYHYGRWVMTSDFGWVWIPGDEWGPAWVQWRRGDRHAGWAPLPPREVIYDYDDDPDFWIFVSFNNFTAPNLRRVILPPRERVVYIRETVIVNRTIIIDRDGRDRRERFAVNPGIEPRIVAARSGKPIRVSNVRPVVVAGTVGVESAVEVRAEDARKQRNRTRAQITESKETVEPAKDVPPPQALKKGEDGRLGERPPEAAKGGKPVPASQADDRTKEDDAARSKTEDAAKAKGTTEGDAATSRTKSGDDAKSKGDEASKSKTDDDARSKAKSTADDDAAKSRSKAADDAAKAKSRSDDDGAKSRARDAAKSKSDDGDSAKAAKSKATESRPEPKAEPKSRERDAEKSKAEPRQAAPKQAPEPKQAAPKQAPEPKQAAPKSAPEPRQAAPEPRQAAPKAEPAPKAAPKGKEKDDEKG
jgi:hypothetical protein